MNNFSKKYSELKKINQKNSKNRKLSNSINEDDNENDGEKTSCFVICKGMHKFNAILKKMIKNNEIQIDEETNSKFRTYYDTISNSLLTKYDSGEKKNKVMYYAILKIMIITLLLFVKNPTEFEDTLFDLSNLLEKLNDLNKNSKVNGSNKKSSNKKEKKNDPMFDNVFTEICLQLNSYGSQTIVDFVMRTFKKVSTFLGLDSLNVLKNYALGLENNDVINKEDEQINNKTLFNSKGIQQKSIK